MGTLRLNGTAGPTLAAIGSGGLNVNQGKLVIAHPLALGTNGPLVFGNSAGATTTELAAETDLTGSNSLKVPVTLGSQNGLTIVSGSNGITLSGTMTVGRPTSGTRTLQNNLTSGTLRIAGDVAVGSNAACTFGLGGSGTTILAGNIVQTGTFATSLQYDGTGLLTLSGSNSHTGTTTINNGMLLVGNTNALGVATSSVVVNSGTLDLGGLSMPARTGNLTIAGGLIQSGTFTVNTSGTFDGQSGTVSATLAGSGGLTKSGTGTLTLTGSNLYAGTTTVTAGALNIRHGVALGGTAAGTVVNGGSLELQGGVTIAGESLPLGTAVTPGAFRTIPAPPRCRR